MVKKKVRKTSKRHLYVWPLDGSYSAFFAFAFPLLPRLLCIVLISMSDNENEFCLACHRNFAEGTGLVKWGRCGNNYHCGMCTGVTKNKVKAKGVEGYQA